MSHDAAAVRDLSAQPIPVGSKGFTVRHGGPPISGETLAAAGATLFGGRLSFPVLILRDGAVTHNIDSLARFTTAHGLELAPHAKTAMAPQLFARQLDAGAWGLTVATIDQVRVLREFGVRRVLLANELLDAGAAVWLAEELLADPSFEFCCYVDSLAGVRLLEQALSTVPSWMATGRRLNVLVELGFTGGRTGVRSLDAGRQVARAVAATSTVAVIGVAGYEGGLGATRFAGVLDRVETWCRSLLELLELLRADGVLSGPGLVTAGGSSFPDVVTRVFADRPAGVTAVLRSGSYLTHDEGLYARLSPFTAPAGSDYRLRPALELWAQVLSRPEPGLAVLGAGRRDIGFDQGMPPADDQHAYLELPEDHPLKPGDLVQLGISHPCTTLDHWRYVVLLDDGDRVLDVVSTFF
jgi:D-serine dehydratase